MLRSSAVALAMVASIVAVDPVRQALSRSSLEELAYNAGREGRSDDAIALYTDAIRKRPDHYVSYYRRGATFLQRGQLEPALADLTAAVRLSPPTKSSNELGLRAWNSLLPESYTLNMVVLSHSLRADVLARLKRPEEAIADLNAAIALDPRRTHLWHRRGLLYMETGNTKAAIADFDALLARRENVEWRFARGLCHYVDGDFAGAEADFQMAAEMDAKNSLYSRWLKKTQKRRGIPI